MNILSKYLFKEVSKLLGIILFALVFIYLIIDFIGKIDNFIEADVPVGPMLYYFVYKVPYILVQMAPVSMLLAVIVMFCIMKKNNEIIAMHTCGLSTFGISRPIFLFSLLISAASFLLSETIVPYASTRGNEIWNVEVNKRIQTNFYGRDQIWYKGENSIYWIRSFDPDEKIMENATFYFFDDSFLLVRKVDAQKCVWTDNKWRAEKGIYQSVNKLGGYDLKKFDEIYLDLAEKPETFFRAVSKPEEMNSRQLKRYAEKIRLEGYDATRYLVDMNIKLAFPLISFIMVLMGIPIALGLRRGGTPLAVSLGIGACFLYLLLFGFARSLGFSGVLPPILAAWLTNIAFFFLGSYLMMHLEA